MPWKEKHWGGHDTACILNSHRYKLLLVGNSWLPGGEALCWAGTVHQMRRMQALFWTMIQPSITYLALMWLPEQYITCLLPVTRSYLVKALGFFNFLFPFKVERKSFAAIVMVKQKIVGRQSSQIGHLWQSGLIFTSWSVVSKLNFTHGESISTMGFGICISMVTHGYMDYRWLNLDYCSTDNFKNQNF